MKGDHIHVHNGFGITVRRDGPQMAGEVRPLRDGQPIPPGAEIMQCRGGHCYESLGPVAGSHGAGPAQVASTAYREGYDRIFGRPSERGQA